MIEHIKRSSFEDGMLCGWCGIPLGSANLVRQLVCIRCYELLSKANLSNEEIFGNEEIVGITDERKYIHSQISKQDKE